MFVGTFGVRLDEKGRIALPAKFRDVLADGVVVTPGQEHCLFVFTREEFQRRAQRAAEQPLGERSRRNSLRLLAAAAHDDTLDRQGRVTLPAHLRAFAGLDRDVTVNGAFNRIELWDSARWAAFAEAEEETFASIDGGVLSDFF